MAPHFLLLLLFMSSLCLGRKKEKTYNVSNTEQNRRFKIKTSRVEKKGYDYQNVDKDDSSEDSGDFLSGEDSHYPDCPDCVYSYEVNETSSK